MSQPASKLTAGELATLLPHVGLDAAAAAVVGDAMPVPEAVNALEAAGFLTEATRLLAHGLPKREAVWWACMCTFHTAPPDLPDADRQCREAAEEWVRRQDEKLRRLAFELAQASGFGSPEAWAATAAFWSGGSMAPEGQPVVPPAPHLTGTAAAGAIALAAVRGDVTRREARLRHFIESARNIAAGGSGRLPAETD